MKLQVDIADVFQSLWWSWSSQMENVVWGTCGELGRYPKWTSQTQLSRHLQKVISFLWLWPTGRVDEMVVIQRWGKKFHQKEIIRNRVFNVPKVSIRSTGFRAIAKLLHVQSNMWLMYKSSDVQYWVWCSYSKNVAVIFPSTADLLYIHVGYDCTFNNKKQRQTIVIEAFGFVWQSGHPNWGEQILLLWFWQEEDWVQHWYLCSDNQCLPTHWFHAWGLGQWGGLGCIEASKSTVDGLRIV